MVELSRPSSESRGEVRIPLRIFRINSSAIALAFLIAWTGSIRAEELSLIEFEVKDQFDHVYRDTDFAGKIPIFFTGDKKGSRFNPAWHEAINEGLAASGESLDVVYIHVADLRKLPKMMRRTVRKRFFPKDKEKWVLLDWEGRLAEAFSSINGKCNITIFGADRRMIYHSSGTEVDDAVVSKIVGSIRESAAE